jgi:hypothetical protein
MMECSPWSWCKISLFALLRATLFGNLLASLPAACLCQPAFDQRDPLLLWTVGTCAAIACAFRFEVETAGDTIDHFIILTALFNMDKVTLAM